MLRPLPVLLAAGSLIGCVDEGGFGVLGGALSALCEIEVISKGRRAVETDYLPNVVACENGNADAEALKAQAVAARTYAYYKIAAAGAIEDGTGDQVYSCSYASAEPRHFEAVAATAGEVLRFGDTIIAAFYVAGAKPSTENCVALPSDPDPTRTERFVTYNHKKSGDLVTQTTLGLVDPKNLANRGCSSQNGAHCLSQRGQPYQQILRFYYGADIALARAAGSCVVVENDAGVTDRGGAEVSADPDGGVDGQDVAGDDGWYDDGGCQLATGDTKPASPILVVLLLLLPLLILLRRRNVGTPGPGKQLQ